MTTAIQPPQVEGDANRVDSFAACVRAALVAWGREAPEQSFLEGLSGAAFAPVCDEDDDCAAWWMEGGNDSRVQFLGRALGFSVVASPRMDGPARREAREEYARSQTLSGRVAGFWEEAMKALGEGSVVVTATWPTWSAVTGWDADLRRLPVSSLPGMQALCVSDPLYPSYILTPAEPELTPAAALAAALQFGGQVASGAFSWEAFRFGARLYEAAAQRLEEGPFCGPCGGRAWSCALRTLRRVRGSQASGAAFLSQAGAREDLDPAIERYQTMGRMVDRHLAGHRVRESWEDEIYQYQLKQTFHHLAGLQRQVGQALNAAAGAVQSQSAR